MKGLRGTAHFVGHTLTAYIWLRYTGCPGFTASVSEHLGLPVKLLFAIQFSESCWLGGSYHTVPYSFYLLSSCHFVWTGFSRYSGTSWAWYRNQQRGMILKILTSSVRTSGKLDEWNGTGFLLIYCNDCFLKAHEIPFHEQRLCRTGAWWGCLWFSHLYVPVLRLLKSFNAALCDFLLKIRLDHGSFQLID